MRGLLALRQQASEDAPAKPGSIGLGYTLSDAEFPPSAAIVLCCPVKHSPWNVALHGPDNPVVGQGC
jgi:hypothetical protein